MREHSDSIHTFNKTDDRTIGAKVNCQNMNTQVRLIEGRKDIKTWQLENVAKCNNRDKNTQVELHEVGKATPLSNRQVWEYNLDSANQMTPSQMSVILFDDLW